MSATFKDFKRQSQTTSIHDFGHYIYETSGIYTNYKTGMSVSVYGQTDIREYFAEWFAHYKINGSKGMPEDDLEYIKTWEKRKKRK